MDKLIEETENLFGVGLRNGISDRLRFTLRMLIINVFPKMKTDEVAKCFDMPTSNVYNYRDSYRRYEETDTIRYNAIKSSFLKNYIHDYEIYCRTQKEAHLERERERLTRIKTKKEIKEAVKVRPKISFHEVCLVLRKDVKSYLNNKNVCYWSASDWEAFNQLKMA
jgi:hypothetical protein